MLVNLDRGAEALEILRALAAENSKDIELLGTTGTLMARLGRIKEARKVEAELAAIARPFVCGRHTYQRACIAAQLGEKERAVSLLRQAFAQGYWYDVGIHMDIDLEPLHCYPPYEELMKPKD